eukprot:4670143-Prymnesium_polylepis.1
MQAAALKREAALAAVRQRAAAEAEKVKEAVGRVAEVASRSKEVRVRPSNRRALDAERAAPFRRARPGRAPP